MIHPVRIGNLLIGPDHPCLVVAEAGVNHNGDLNIAHRLIDAAVKAGADAVKFQSFMTEEIVTPATPKAGYQESTTGISGGQYEMLKALELTRQDHAELKDHCDDAGILYLCTPYETASIDMLSEIGVAAYKVASTDTTNIPFLRYMAQKKLPVILSTGMCTLGEVEQAVNVLKSEGLKNMVVILQCTSEYPAPIHEVNLRAMHTMEHVFACPVGFSDHTQGIGASPWAVASRACLIEKHFTLDRNFEGPDHRASIEPHELETLVKTIRQVESALGDGIKRLMPSEAENKSKMQKSLVAKRTIKAEEIIQAQDLTCKRPGNGLQPKWFDRVIGKKAIQNIDKDSFITLAAIKWE